MASFVGELNSSFFPEPEGNVFNSIWKECEGVVFKSLITSFGLDFLVQDQYGGDVDTVHNVRAGVAYKNQQNKADYDNRGTYSTAEYHSDPRYTSIVRKAKKEFNENGIMLNDSYVKGNTVIPTGNSTIPRNRQAQLDHVVAAEQVHNDPGRILAGLDGKELANSPDNLKFTNAALNRNMSNMSVEEYIEWCESHPEKVNWNGKKGEPLPEEVKEQLRKEYHQAKASMDAKINRKYYTSSKFLKDSARAMGLRGVQMGARQVVGFVFLEMWLASKEELQKIRPGSQLKEMLEAVAEGIKKGLENAKVKYKEVLAQFGQGFVSGALASLTTTICNIFFTTAKNLGRCIRQIFASVVEAGRVLLFNPDNLMLGDRLKTSSVILATGASVLVGTAVGELIGKTPISAIPGVGPFAQTFCSTLVSGLLSCTFLIFLDRSSFMNRLIDAMNSVDQTISNYREIADAFEYLATKLENIDFEQFRQETEKYKTTAVEIAAADSEEEVENILLVAYKQFNIKIPWEGDFDMFMGNKENRLVFS